MNDFPQSITNSRLWAQIDSQPDLQSALKELRTTASVVAAKIAEVLPDYTDHSFVHMDALWGISEQVFTEQEIKLFSPGEAFILACTFYIHDIGMALAATPQGVRELESSSSFKATFDRLVQARGYEDDTARRFALKDAARELHAEKAEQFIDQKLPGLDRFLIEKKELREQWGNHIGLVAASHHWSLQEVEKRLGIRGRIPDLIGGEIDLGFLACALRIIDYAHINAQRAPSLDRVLRSGIEADSLKHWNAQEHITGPSRDKEALVYGSTRALKDIDAWWMFYEMASGLDREIASVNDYLGTRATSLGRYSLEGVKGADSPKRFAVSVPTEGFEPVDLHFHPDSMERLIEILGGKSLYGDDYFAPIRELLQNARDAILLQKASAELADYTTEPGEIRITLNSSIEHTKLIVADNGVGMSERVISNYLLGIASNYWHSSEFFAEYPDVHKTGFGPAGRFGIGFLSVFMLGDEITVETQRRGGENLVLKIRGIGRRGSLERKRPNIKAGTSIQIALPRSSLGDFDNLDAIVRAKAPMLEIPVLVTQQNRTIEIEPQWWKAAGQEEFLDFLGDREFVATTPQRFKDTYNPSFGDYPYTRRNRAEDLKENFWIDRRPEAISDSFRIVATPGIGHVVICSKGFAIDTVHIPGMVGVTEIGDVEVDAARSKTLRWDHQTFRKRLIERLKPRILEGLEDLEREFSIPSKYSFLNSVSVVYGQDFLTDTKLPWISIIEPPGRVEMLNPIAFADKLKNREIFLVFGDYATPWNAADFCLELFPDMGNKSLIVPVPDADQPGVGNFHEDDTVFGPLPEHFFENFGRGKYPDDTGILNAILQIISRSTTKPLEELNDLRWIRKERTVGARLILD
jgi:hypothetical protein